MRKIGSVRSLALECQLHLDDLAPDETDERILARIEQSLGKLTPAARASCLRQTPTGRLRAAIEQGLGAKLTPEIIAALVQQMPAEPPIPSLPGEMLRQSRPGYGEYEYDPDRAPRVLEMARAGNTDAIAAVRDVAAWLIDKGRTLPHELGRLVAELSAELPRRPRGRPAERGNQQDFCTAVDVGIVGGLPRTHGRERKRNTTPSATSLARAALASGGHTKAAMVDDKAVEKAWERRNRRRTIYVGRFNSAAALAGVGLIHRHSTERTTMQTADTAQQQPTAAEQVAAHIERVAAVAAPFDCLLNIDNLVEMGCGSRTQIYKQVRVGSFPAPVRLGLARTRWRQSEVLAWNAGSPAQQRAGPAAVDRAAGSEEARGEGEARSQAPASSQSSAHGSPRLMRHGDASGKASP